MHGVSLENARGTSDPGLSVADSIESSRRYLPSNAAGTAAVLRPDPIYNSIFRETDGRLNRPLIWALSVAGLLTLGHFVCPASSGRRISVDRVAQIAQVILSRGSPRQEMPRVIAPAAPNGNPENELRGGQA